MAPPRLGADEIEKAIIGSPEEEIEAMWLLFDLTKCCILNAAPEARQLRFEEDELPPHLQTVMSPVCRGTDRPDPLSPGVRPIGAGILESANPPTWPES